MGSRSRSFHWSGVPPVLVTALLVGLVLGSGCTGKGDGPNCPPRATAPVRTRGVDLPRVRPDARDVTEPVDEDQASLIVEVTGGARTEPERVRLRIDGVLALDVDLPAQGDGRCSFGGHDPTFNYGYDLPPGPAIVTGRAGAQTARLRVDVPAEGAIWLVVDSYGGELPLELTTYPEAPQWL